LTIIIVLNFEDQLLIRVFVLHRCHVIRGPPLWYSFKVSIYRSIGPGIYSCLQIVSWDGVFIERSGLRRLASSEMLRSVALVRTDVSEELSASVIRLTRMGELGKFFFVACVGCYLELALFLVQRFLSPWWRMG
jgi:hypothetical protein